MGRLVRGKFFIRLLAQILFLMSILACRFLSLHRGSFRAFFLLKRFLPLRQLKIPVLCRLERVSAPHPLLLTLLFARSRAS